MDLYKCGFRKGTLFAAFPNAPQPKDMARQILKLMDKQICLRAYSRVSPITYIPSCQPDQSFWNQDVAKSRGGAASSSMGGGGDFALF